MRPPPLRKRGRKLRARAPAGRLRLRSRRSLSGVSNDVSLSGRYCRVSLPASLGAAEEAGEPPPKRTFAMAAMLLG